MSYRLLDLFCGAGGSAVGYSRAGFDVTGVDIRPQPHYPFVFRQDDALELMQRMIERPKSKHWFGNSLLCLDDFDAIHASPPCQGYSRLRHLPWLKGRVYPMLIGETRDALRKTGKPYVIENVEDAPLNGALLCGAAVGLQLLRHRRFESNILLLFPPCPGHPVLFHGSANMKKYGQGHGVTGIADGQDPHDVLGIEWMTGKELRQAIPPAYTTFIGKQLLDYLKRGEQC